MGRPLLRVRRRLHPGGKSLLVDAETHDIVILTNLPQLGQHTRHQVFQVPWRTKGGRKPCTVEINVQIALNRRILVVVDNLALLRIVARHRKINKLCLPWLHGKRLLIEISIFLSATVYLFILLSATIFITTRRIPLPQVPW